MQGYEGANNNVIIQLSDNSSQQDKYWYFLQNHVTKRQWFQVLAPPAANFCLENAHALGSTFLSTLKSGGAEENANAQIEANAFEKVLRTFVGQQ